MLVESLNIDQMSDPKCEYHFIDYHLELCKAWSQMIDYKKAGSFMVYH
jgi:hypothetical protein